jgi:hypothetical protein
MVDGESIVLVKILFSVMFYHLSRYKYNVNISNKF